MTLQTSQNHFLQASHHDFDPLSGVVKLSFITGKDSCDSNYAVGDVTQLNIRNWADNDQFHKVVNVETVPPLDLTENVANTMFGKSLKQVVQDFYPEQFEEFYGDVDRILCTHRNELWGRAVLEPVSMFELSANNSAALET